MKYIAGKFGGRQGCFHDSLMAIAVPHAVPKRRQSSLSFVSLSKEQGTTALEENTCQPVSTLGIDVKRVWGLNGDKFENVIALVCSLLYLEGGVVRSLPEF